MIARLRPRPDSRGVPPPVIVAAALLLGWPLAAALLPHGAPVGLVLSGIVIGAANGLLAIGLILIYRTNRIVNFAHGSLGAVAGLFGPTARKANG